jgi:N-acetylglutamate synthase-like GNAT family acetyltransferase
MLLGQLAAHKDYRGMGMILLDFVINHSLELATKVGCRMIHVHSVKGKEWWYKKNGFELVKGTERTLYGSIHV